MAEIDERFFPEWFERGWSDLVLYLARWAEFRAYEADRVESDVPDRQARRP